MKESSETDVVKLLMDLSYLSAMLAVDIEEDRAAGMERLQVEFEQLDDLLAEIDEQIFNFCFARQALFAAKLAGRITVETRIHNTPKTMQ